VEEIKKRIMIIGATSLMAEHCARLWVKDSPVDLTLVGRSTQKLEQVAEDLKVRSPHSNFNILQTDFIDPIAIRALIDKFFEIGTVDIVLIAHGSLPDQNACQDNLVDCHRELLVNGVSPVLFAEACAFHMQQSDYGRLVVIGSVAGDRGRKSNYIYGAAKGLVTRYVQGLQHRFADTNVKITLVKPGPTDTPMTAHLKSKNQKLASVQDVAKLIVDAVDRGESTVYAPRKWGLIMMIIRHLPTIVFNKMNI